MWCLWMCKLLALKLTTDHQGNLRKLFSTKSKWRVAAVMWTGKIALNMNKMMNGGRQKEFWQMTKAVTTDNFSINPSCFFLLVWFMLFKNRAKHQTFFFHSFSRMFYLSCYFWIMSFSKISFERWTGVGNACGLQP